MLGQHSNISTSLCISRLAVIVRPCSRSPAHHVATDLFSKTTQVNNWRCSASNNRSAARNAGHAFALLIAAVLGPVSGP